MEQQLRESPNQPLNGSVVQPESKQYELLPKQQEYFQQAIKAMNELQQQMRVALQMIAWERGIQGQVGLSQDCTKLVEQAQTAV
jgi:alpha-tubulin suppressor-like RCC1 family protein